MVNRPDHPQPGERIKAWLFPQSNRMMVEVPAPYNEAWGALTNGQQSFSSGVLTGNTRVSHARPQKNGSKPGRRCRRRPRRHQRHRYASLDTDTNARGHRTTNPDGNAAASSRLCADASGMAVTEGHAFDSLRHGTREEVRLQGRYLGNPTSARRFWLASWDVSDPSLYGRQLRFVKIITNNGARIPLEPGPCYEANVVKHVASPEGYVCLDRDSAYPQRYPCDSFREHEVIPTFLLYPDKPDDPETFTENLIRIEARP